MRFMDTFCFPTSNSSTGPNCSFSQEIILKDCDSDLMENLALSSVSPYDFVPLDLSALKQGFLNVYSSVIQSANVRGISAGIVAAAVICGAWKAGVVWNNNMSSTTSDSLNVAGGSLVRKTKRHDSARRKDYEDSAAYKPLSSYSMERCTAAMNQAISGRPSQTSSGAEELVAMSETFQRQLKDAVSKLEDVKFRLKELESEKDLLTAEMAVRKEMIHKLQDENSSEREKRQQAELKMEMMSLENMQIRQLRKEVAVKSCQLERLERLMREKDDLQMKLFSDNVVLPRCVVEARAHEFSELQNRVHQLQAEIDSTRRFREFDIDCQPFRLANSVWLEDGSLPLPTSHVSEISMAPKSVCPLETTVAFPESMAEKLSNTTSKLDDRSPTNTMRMTQSMEKPNLGLARSFVLPNTASPGERYVHGMKDNNSAMNESSTSNTDKINDLTQIPISMHYKNSGVFSQIRAVINGFRDNSLDCSPSHVALLNDLGTLLNGSRPNGNITLKQQNSPSDKQRNSFELPSCCLDSSDTDQSRSHYSSVRRFQYKKALPLKRLSRYRRDKRKDIATLKKRLAVQYFDGQARLIGFGESSGPPLVSREQCDASEVKHHSSTDTRENNAHICVRSITDIKNSNLLSNCETNTAQSGDSWILIIPKDSKIE